MCACECVSTCPYRLACVEIYLCERVGLCLCASKLKAVGPCVTAQAFDV